MTQQRRLDLTKLDPEAAQLHLLVGAADELQFAVVRPLHHVTGAVHPRTGRPERISHKPLRRQTRPIQIPTGNPHPANEQLPRHPRRHQPQTSIQHIRAHVVDRPADRHHIRHRLHRAHRPHRGVCRGLRRAVDVHHHQARTRVQHPTQRGGRYHLATRPDLLRAREGVRRLLCHDAEQA